MAKVRPTMAVLCLWFVVVAYYVRSTGGSSTGPVGVPLCWGDNTGNKAVVPQINSTFTYLSASVEETCGLGTDGLVRCWGVNTWGQGTVSPNVQYSNVSAGWDHSCAINAATNLTTCWGLNNHQQLDVPAGAYFQSLQCGYWHSCGILANNGTLLCWGGSGDKNQSQMIVPATTVPFDQVAASEYHTCGLLRNGTILCWGDNSNNQTAVPQAAAGTAPFTFQRVGTGIAFSCGLRTNGSILCWGDNTNGQASAPTDQTFTDLVVGGHHACGLKSTGALYCWGDNTYGQSNVPSPYTWKGLTAGEYHMCGFGVATTPSPTPSPRTPSPTPAMSAPRTSSPTPAMSASPLVSPSPTPALSAPPLVTPSPLPLLSPTPAVTLAPISANVTATFGSDSPIVDVAAPVASGSGGSTSKSDVRVRSELTGLQAGNDNLTNIQWSVVSNNASAGGNSSSSSSTVLYSALLPDNTTSVTQTYAFHPQTQESQFSGLNFTISAGAVKWSINLTSTAAEGSNSSSSGLRFSFRLSTNSTLVSAGGTVKLFRNQPRANMTTYWVPSGYTDVAVEVQVFDVALVDGVLLAINHSVVAASNGPSAAYDLVLSFPPFTRSLEYDPSIGLGALLGASKGDGGGSSSDNTAVIVGVAVAVPVAIVVVLAVVVAALLYGLYRRKQAGARVAEHSTVNFERDTQEDPEL